MTLSRRSGPRTPPGTTHRTVRERPGTYRASSCAPATARSAREMSRPHSPTADVARPHDHPRDRPRTAPTGSDRLGPTRTDSVRLGPTRSDSATTEPSNCAPATARFASEASYPHSPAVGVARSARGRSACTSRAPGAPKDSIAPGQRPTAVTGLLTTGRRAPARRRLRAPAARAGHGRRSTKLLSSRSRSATAPTGASEVPHPAKPAHSPDRPQHLHPATSGSRVREPSRRRRDSERTPEPHGPTDRAAPLRTDAQRNHRIVVGKGRCWARPSDSATATALPCTHRTERHAASSLA